MYDFDSRVHSSMSPKGVEHKDKIAKWVARVLPCIHQCRRKALSTPDPRREPFLVPRCIHQCRRKALSTRHGDRRLCPRRVHSSMSVNGNRKPHICGNRKLHTSGRYISGGADVLPLMLVGRFGLDAGSGATGVLANTRREAAQPAVTLRLPHAAVPTQPAASADAPASGSCCPGC